MAIRLLNRFPGANVRVLTMKQAPSPEVVFTPDPHGGPEALWFYFRIEDPEPPTPVPESLELTLRFFGNHAGADDSELYRPVIREIGKSWNRLRPPVVTRLDDDQPLLHWTIPYPTARIEIAFCHPYGRDELDVMLQRAKGYWREEAIGLTQTGRVLTRLDNRAGGKGKGARGLYLLARQHPGESPGSWILDGMLETLSRARSANWCIWCIPFADLDGVIAGDCGGDFSGHGGNPRGESPARHEVSVLQSDINRWAIQCRPELIINLRAAGPCECSGIYAPVPPLTSPEDERNRQTWTNIMQQALGPEFAAEPFTREVDALACFSEYIQKAPGCCALTIRTPNTSCRDTLMTPKQYREAGRRLAQAILNRW